MTDKCNGPGFTPTEGEELVSMIGAGLVDLGLLEPHAYPLEQLNEALAAVESQANGFTNFHITHA